jgi:hypothetical protein
MHSSDADRTEQERTDRTKEDELPPGADTRGAEGDASGAVREAAPYEEAPAEGRLAPDADNPPPTDE